ncbi:MAG: glutamate formimidoyltransferase [Bryobacterales bacterium]|nr:glutamate formimidoyltransferase [Bryobacterales bacterium]
MPKSNNAPTMAAQLVECVPNFSEGRDPAVIQALAAAAESVGGVCLLDVEHDSDHNRCVLTMAGEPEDVLEAALRSAAVAAAKIDLTTHRGVHPRIGALDVLPFVPVQGVSMDECVGLAREAAARLWGELGIPTYFYGEAARTPERQNLEAVRKGQFEGLREAVLQDAARRPDVGGPRLHPTAGASAVGARKYLVAWNVWLRTEDLDVPRTIAKRVRESSGGFRCVKALGLPLASRHITQVSLNSTDYEVTPLSVVFDAIEEEAKRRNVEVLGSELIGLIPRAAVEENFAERLRWLNFTDHSVLEYRIDAMRREGRC